MGIDYDSCLVCGVKMGEGWKIRENIEAFLKAKGIEKVPNCEDPEEMESLEEAGLYELWEKLGEVLKDSPFDIGYASPYYDCPMDRCIFYVMYYDFGEKTTIQEAMEIFNAFDMDQWKAFLKSFGMDENKEPTIFSLPNVW